MASPAPKVFISYSHQDEAWKERVVTQLGVLARQGRLEIWEDRRIAGGDDWFPEIERAVEACDVALLLISAHFLTSGFILKEEVPRLLARRARSGVRVLPVILRPCAWEAVDWLAAIQARPKDGKPLSGMTRTKAEAALAALAREVLDLSLVTSAPVERLPLTPEEQDYLNALIGECDRLPLAEESRNVRPGEDATLPASLAQVYVGLATTSQPSLELIFDRLGIAAGERHALRGELAAGLPDRELSARADLPDEEDRLPQVLMNLDDRLLQRMPRLRSLAKDKDKLAAALRPVTALEALASHSRWVLLGPPGSGKSTFVQHLAATFARAFVGEKRGWKGALESRFEEPLFPVRIVLRRLRAAPAKPGQGKWALLEQALADLGPGIPWKRWQERFRSPDTLILFDGLDEVPAGEGVDDEAEDRRGRAAQAIRDLCAAFPGCKVLVSCRVKPYREGKRLLPELAELELAPLDPERIERFCHLWHRELFRTGRLRAPDAATCRDHLLAAIRDAARKNLAEMARSPLLLTMLAKVNIRAELPEGRAELFEECVEQLLWEWEKSKSEGAEIESLDRLLREAAPRIERFEVERALFRLAYEVHATVAEGTATLPADRLEAALAGLRGREPRQAMKDWARRVVRLMLRRDGLLVTSNATAFTFPHRSFQEYLAARWVVQASDVPSAAFALAGQEIWYETLVLACGHLATSSSAALLGVLHALASGKEPQAAEDWRRLLLAGRAWLDFKVDQAAPTDELAEGRQRWLRQELPSLLTRLLRSPALAPAQRLEAAEILADLGEVPAGLDERVLIPAGSLGYAFRIGKYPVTNDVFRTFVEDGGYRRDRSWWSDQGGKDLERYGWPEGPRLWGDPAWDRPTFPVVGVSWYEARAFCRWWTLKLRAAGDLGQDEVVTLPTAAEWEAAARGHGSGKYPWGDEPVAARANTKASGLNRTTPVHMHAPQSAEPEICDLIGNVWEWLEDPYEDWARQLAGGAYWTEIGSATSAARNRNHPRYRYYYIGFRVVVVPSSRRSSES